MPDCRDPEESRSGAIVRGEATTSKGRIMKMKRGRALMRRRGERIARASAHCRESGGMSWR
jgi:hypothetical protein